MINDSRYKYHVNLAAFHITLVCSHKCSFCYATNDNIKRSHPSFEKLKKVVDVLASARVKEITFLGGDPASYPRIVDLAKYATDSGIKTGILSNTLSFPRNSLEQVVKYIEVFETTIHDANPELHDKICGRKGAYRRVVNQLRIIADTGRKIGIAINITPVISNKIYQLVDRIANVEKVTLNHIIIQRIIPMGRAVRSFDYALTGELVEKALFEIRKVDKNFGIKVTIEDPFPLCILSPEIKNYIKKYMNPCEWGFTKVAVDSNGNLSRCGADSRYRLGNIFKTPLLKIWNESEILKSFRNKSYLPGECQVCADLQKCGGGCSLSCEIEKDHGKDYLYLEYEKLIRKKDGDIVFSFAKKDELSSILQLEWVNFPGYRHLFSVESIKKWYKHNPKMFYVVRDSRRWILGYATVVPISEELFKNIRHGKFSSLDSFPEKEVLRNENTHYFHIEVVATLPSMAAMGVGRFVIKSVGSYLLKHAKHVTTSPITEIGLRLCNYFGFEYVTDEKLNGEKYPIYILEIDKKDISTKLNKF